MNISTTAKRLLRSVAVLSIVAVGSSAYAAYEYTEDFESHTNGTLIVGESSGDGLDWTGDAGDLSSVITTNVPFSGGTFPVSPVVSSKVLQLNTEGNTLTNTPTVSLPSDAVYYVDQMVYLVPSESEPTSITNDTSVQGAVYLNASSNLVAWTGGEDGDAEEFVTFTNTVLPETWARLTIMLDFANGDGGPPLFPNRRYMQIMLNGTALYSTSGYANVGDTGVPAGGTWFRTANKGTTTDSLHSVAYQGTGMIDEVVITDTDPFGSTTFYYISSFFTGDGTVAPSASIEVAAGSDQTVTYTINDEWDEITALYINGVPVTGGITNGAVMQFTHSNVQEDFSNHCVIAAAAYAYDGMTPASWATNFPAANVANEDGDSYDLYNEYLINTDPTVSNLFEIIEIGFDGAKPYVLWNGEGEPNGLLTVSNTADLVNGPWTNLVGTVDESAAPVIKWTGTEDASAGDALKLVVTD